MNTVFRDYLGREIKVGDVIADGHRDGNTGGIGLSIVRSFIEAKDSWTPSRMQVEVAQRGKWYGTADKQSWWATDDGNAWRFFKSYRTHGERCFITGLTEEQLRDLVAKATKRVKAEQ